MTRKSKQRKNNRTKKHVGGGPDLNSVIDLLINNAEQVSMVFKKNTYKIQFIDKIKFKIVDEPQIVDPNVALLQKDSTYEYQIVKKMFSYELIFKETLDNTNLKISKQSTLEKWIT